MLSVKNNLTISMLFLLMFAIGAGNLFAGDFSKFNQLWSVESNPVWANYPADTISVGESRSVTIKANEPYNYTGIKLWEGTKYKFTVGNPEWTNGGKITDAGGYNSSDPRRYTDYKMMALVGEIYSSNNNPSAWTGKKFLIGLGRDSYTAAKTGYLVAFANDCLPCYSDNYNDVKLTVERIE